MSFLSDITGINIDLGGGGGGGGGAKAQKVELDPRAKESLEKYSQEAGVRSAQDYAAESMKGVDQGPSDLSAQMQQREKSLGGYEPGIGQAIEQRYRARASEGFNKLKNQAELTGYATKAERLQNAAAMNQAVNNVNAQNQQRQNEADAANKRARSSALGSVLGIAGAIAGNMIAPGVGGSVGAAAGSMIGSSI